jgi:predicted unusual protein kinase regulating ubiquinone biosynthesis (AarF/ABC1/UbiB family)
LVTIEGSSQDITEADEYLRIGAPEGFSRYRNPSRFSILKTIFKLVPLAIRLRQDRREWVRKEGKNIDETKFKKHAEKALTTFISLGPSYIKLGQWLSSRSDVLPQPYLDVFARLQDDVPPAPFDKTRKIIEAELGPVSTVFEAFDNNPISGASLGQVYLARHIGKEVIVKVSRPDIENRIADDIYILRKLLPIATRFIDPNLKFCVEGMLEQFADTVKEEMDYRMEAHNLITIKENLKDDPSVLIPEVFRDRTSRHVLTLEYLPGIKITDIERLDSINIDRSKLVVRVHRVFFKMLLRHSIFHADPHPGNIAVSESGKIILYDFGMVGRLDDETRRKLIRLYLGLIDKDPVRTTDVLIELGTLEPSVNRHIIEKGLQLSIQSLYGKKVDRMEVKALQDLANKTMSRFPFRLPKNLALYMRMASILEGIYKHHNVKFEFVRVMANLLEEEGLLKEAYFEEVKKSITKFFKNLEMSTELAPLIKEYIQSQEQRRSSGRTYRLILPASIFSSAIIIGSALIYPSEHFFGYFGFAISGIIILGSLIYNKFRGQSA